jgi:Tol biopolymer transport system component
MRRKRLKAFFFILAMIFALNIPSASLAAVGDTIHISKSTTEVFDDSYSPAISDTGRYVAFVSDAVEYVASDTNSSSDIFVRDTQARITTRVSLATGGTEGNGHSDAPSISGDGRYVAFESVASDLVSGDTNGYSDIFLHDTQTGTTTRVSVATGGIQGNGTSTSPAVSEDGRYVVFVSEATNLVSGDTNSVSDIFMHDTQTGITTRVSVATLGSQAWDASDNPAVSADGRYVVFESDASNLVGGDFNGTRDVFVRDTQGAATTRVSLATGGLEANGGSENASISGDGRYVVFGSGATNLVAGDTNGWADIFRHDNQTGTTTRVSVSTASAQANSHCASPTVSDDGRYVSFYSFASNLVTGDTNGAPDVFLRDTSSNTTSRVSVHTEGVQGDAGSYFPATSGDGRFTAYHSSATNLVTWDTNGAIDVFLHDAQIGMTTRVSSTSFQGTGSNNSRRPDVSSNGRIIVFDSSAAYFVDGDTNGYRDIFAHEVQSGTNIRVSVKSDGTQADGDSSNAAVSADGQFVTYDSAATNLVSGDTNGWTDIFLHDTETGTTSRVSVSTGGIQADEDSSNPTLSADGRYVVFTSKATNLVSGDTNGWSDVFLHDTQTGTTSCISLAWDGSFGVSLSREADISADGRYVAFTSKSALVIDDTNGDMDIYVRDTQTGTSIRVSLATGGTQSNDDSTDPSISADGRYIAFESLATNLVSGDTNGVSDIFVHDTQTSTTSRVSLATGGTQANDYSYMSTISADGRYIAFESDATNLVGGDTNGYRDIFMHDTATGTTTRVSVATDGTQGDFTSRAPAISEDGTYVAFESAASTLGSGEISVGSPDIFRHENYIEAPTVTAIVRAGSNPIVPSNVEFTVNFSEDVTLVDSGDFSLTTSGSISGASIVGVSGTGATYTVTVDTGTGFGTLRLDVPITATIENLIGIPLYGLPFTFGEAYAIVPGLYLPLIMR